MGYAASIIHALPVEVRASPLAVPMFEVFRVAKLRQPDELGGLGALALVGQVGLAAVVPIVAGVAGGLYLDNRLGGSGLVLIGMIGLGIGASFFAAYRVISRHLG